MSSKKIRAFTIMEVTVTMLIAGLLIGITYLSYSIIIKSYQVFKTKNDQVSELIGLDHILKRDFTRADHILKDSSGCILVRDSLKIEYHFDQDFVLRKSTRSDTFKVRTQNVSSYFEKSASDNHTLIQDQHLIDELDFTVFVQDREIRYQYKKRYSSKTLMERSQDAFN